MTIHKMLPSFLCVCVCVWENQKENQKEKSIIFHNEGFLYVVGKIMLLLLNIKKPFEAHNYIFFPRLNLIPKYSL